MAKDVSLNEKWVCININERYCHLSYYKAIKEELKNIFQDDLHEILFIGNTIEDNIQENMLETYIFIKCSNVYSYCSQMETSKYFKTILSTYSNVNFISDMEIELMRQDWKAKQKEQRVALFFGDIVLVKEGLYKDLYGVLIDKNEDKYIVIFRLCNGYCTSQFNECNLIKDKNIFDFVKVKV